MDINACGEKKNYNFQINDNNEVKYTIDTHQLKKKEKKTIKQIAYKYRNK